MVRGCNILGFLSMMMMLAWFKDVYLESKYLAPKKAAGIKEL
jgi:hypothetical protein